VRARVSMYWWKGVSERECVKKVSGDLFGCVRVCFCVFTFMYEMCTYSAHATPAQCPLLRSFSPLSKVPLFPDYAFPNVFPNNFMH
jgi:hypothetical protein